MDSNYLQTVRIYEECQASICFGKGDTSGQAKSSVSINSFISTWLARSAECGVRSAEWTNEECRKYGVGKMGNIKAAITG